MDFPLFKHSVLQKKIHGISLVESNFQLHPNLVGKSCANPILFGTKDVLKNTISILSCALVLNKFLIHFTCFLITLTDFSGRVKSIQKNIFFIILDLPLKYGVFRYFMLQWSYRTLPFG